MGKWILQMWLRLRILRWDIIQDYLEGFNLIISVLKRTFSGWSQGQRKIWLQKNGQRDARPRKWVQSQGMYMFIGSWEREENGFSARASRKKHSLPHTLILAHWDPCWTSHLQNYKIVHLHCFKPWTLYNFIATIEI